LRFGCFSPFRRTGLLTGVETESQLIDGALAEIKHAEAVGLDDVFLTEGYFTGPVSNGASTLQQASFIARLTNRVRIVTAVTSLPMHNPLVVAIEAANIDHFTNGRFELGFGRSFSTILCPTDPPWSDGFLGLGDTKRMPNPLPEDNGRAKYLESIACVKGLLENEVFSFKGDYYELDEVELYPRPYQQPSLPLWGVAQSVASYEGMGRAGVNLMIPWPGYHGNFETWEGTIEGLAQYRAAWREAGHPGSPLLSVRVLISLAESKQDAWDYSAKCFEAMAGIHGLLADSAMAHTTGLSSEALITGIVGGPKSALLNAMENATLEETIESVTVTGTPEFATEQFQRIKEEFQADSVQLDPIGAPWGDREMYAQSLKLIADQVMPHFK
jgi:alkanesulfonate monooxygenase SsuD/methylene tetrahydromethanopterin reductase-like flavin-dependent oxidoreductase (luciferase family)